MHSMIDSLLSHLHNTDYDNDDIMYIAHISKKWAERNNSAMSENSHPNVFYVNPIYDHSDFDIVIDASTHDELEKAILILRNLRSYGPSKFRSHCCWVP